MATPAQIEEQVQLERDQIAQGLKRLRDNTRKLEDKEYASAAIYGVAAIDTLLPLVCRRIEETVEYKIKRGKTGVAFKEIMVYLKDVEPLAAAAIACKITVDKVFSVKEGSDKLTKVCESIGQAVEQECQMRHYEREAPGLLHILCENYWHRSIGTQQKITVIQTLMNRYDVKRWDAWGAANRIKLGAWLLDCVIGASGWFTKELRREGRKTNNYIVPTAEFLEIKDEVMSNAELFSPIAWPMTIEPNDWEPHRQGGYLLNEVMRGHEMVRRGDTGPLQDEKIYKFLNKIQKVAYTLNPFIVEVSEELERRGYHVGKFLPIHHHELPVKPPDIATNELARKDYRRRTAEAMNKNAQEFKRSCRTRMTMEAVQRFKNRERFFLPWSLDYRGRAYPIPAFLTPQCTDWGKSLLRFADASFMTPEAEGWLAFQVATCGGQDKASMKERQDWVIDNLDLIERVATDPIGNLHDWENIDEPFQFLAACEEYYHCVVICDRQYTSLCVATDATCSGLQVLAGLARDASTATLVNVLPSEEPQDAYKVVAETAKPYCPASIRPYLDRKVVKRVVMTVPYNAKPYSNRGYIRDALKEKNIEITKDDLTATVRAVRDAMDVVVPGPMAVMTWIEQEVAKCIKRGDKEIQWVTPSGFVVTQKLMKQLTQVCDLKILGRCEVKIATGDGNKVDINHHKNATAPNLIHSLDASILHLTALEFNQPISLIHDSVLCRATDMSLLSTKVRETYMHIFADQDYLTSWAEQIGAEEQPPIIGDLEPSEVIESTYFFC
jgi:DNA-directed RNA polymerase